MHSKARSLLSQESQNKLKLLIGYNLEEVYITAVGTPSKSHNSINNMGLIVVFKSGEHEIVVSNSSILHEEIEFPNLSISNKKDYNDEYEFLTDLETINTALNISWNTQTIKSISLLKDNVCWMDGNTTWELEIEIGIKLKFESHELLIMAKDSSIGLVELWLGENLSWIKNTDKLAENYMFDFDQLISIERLEVKLFPSTP